MLFSLLIVVATMKIDVRSPILQYCGKHLQGLFLIHRVPLILLGAIPQIKNGNIYIYFVLFVVLTFVSEFIFNKTIVFLKGGHQ